MVLVLVFVRRSLGRQARNVKKKSHGSDKDSAPISMTPPAFYARNSNICAGFVSCMAARFAPILVTPPAFDVRNGNIWQTL